MRNNGNGYKALYDLMQYHATQLNVGTSSRIRNEGPPIFGKSKSIDEFIGRYREYWVQRYYFSSNRTVCLSPELQMNFVDRLPRDIKLAFTLYYWRPEYDTAPADFWYYNSIPTPLMFNTMSEYIHMACERRDVQIDTVIQKSRGAGVTHATVASEADEILTQLEDDMDLAQVCAVTGARDNGPTGQCTFCPNHQGRHDIKNCFYLAKLVAGMKLLSSDPALHQHFAALHPGHLKNLPPPPPRPTNGSRGGSRDAASKRGAGATSGGRRPPASSKGSSRSSTPRAPVVHATTADDDASVGSHDTAAAGEGDAADTTPAGHCRALAGADDPFHTDIFDHFDTLAAVDHGSIRALSNAPFARFAVEDADDFVPSVEFPDPDVEDCSYADVECLLHPFEADDVALMETPDDHGMCRMTRGTVHGTRSRGPTPWANENERYLYAHMDHGANLSVVYDSRVLHRFVERPGIVIHDVGDHRHPTLGYGFISIFSSSHGHPVYIPAYYCPSLASNIISPGQFAKFVHGRSSSTVLDHDGQTGHMQVIGPVNTHDIVIRGILYEHLLWAGPLLLPPEDLASQSIVQPWPSLGPSLRDAPPHVSGAGEGGDNPNLVRMTRTRSAARANPQSPPNVPSPTPAAPVVLAPVVPAAVPAPPDPVVLAPVVPATVPAPPDPVGTHENRIPPHPDDATHRRQYLRALLHQRLGHLHQRRLTDLHRFVDGVPPSLGTPLPGCECGVCLAAKMRRSPAGSGNTRRATAPFAGLSVDLGFVVQKPDKQKVTESAMAVIPRFGPLTPLSSDAFDRLSPWHKYKYQVGLSGEIGYVVIQDHFTGALFGTTLTSKAPPVDYLRSFLERHRCSCPRKVVRLDHGGDLGGSRRVRELFASFGYSIELTASDTPHQNGLIERVNQDVGSYLRVSLSGASLTPAYWPFAFRHFLRLYNSLPHRRTDADGKSTLTRTPYEAITGIRPDISSLRTFGCRVWVRPPGGRDRKAIGNARVGRFLGFARSTSICVYIDEVTKEVKETSNLRFDELFSDVLSPPPNAIVLRSLSNGQTPSPVPDEIVMTPDQLALSFHPSLAPVNVNLPLACDHPTGGIILAHDETRDRAYISRLVPKSSAAKAKLSKYVGAYLLRANGCSVQHIDDVQRVFTNIAHEKGTSIMLVLDPEPLEFAQRRESGEMRLSSEQLAAIHSLRVSALRDAPAPDGAVDDFLAFYDTECEKSFAHSLSAASTGTDEERKLPRLTRARLKRLSTWDLWQRGDKGEFAQLDAMAKQGMYGPPTDLPKGAVLLRQHWTYIFKSDGTRKARNCCDGSARAAPALHGAAKTYASCIEQPCMRLFFGLCAINGMIIYGADATNAFANSPPPSIPTYVSIDDAYWEWYLERFNVRLDRSKVLPVMHALQGHPESGYLWEQLIDGILRELGLRNTTHERNLYYGTVSSVPVLVCRQVDDLAVGSPDVATYDAIIDRVGQQVELVKQGVLTRFNGVDIQQTREYIAISCTTYIKQLLVLHGWSKPARGEDSQTPVEPLPADMVEKMQHATGFPEGSPEHRALEEKFRFSYRNVIGELVWVFIVGRIDLGFSIGFMTRFSAAPAPIHYQACIRLSCYLRVTKDWKLIFWRDKPIESLPAGDVPLYVDPQPALVAAFPAVTDPFALTAFADAAHATDLQRRRSVSGYCCMFAGAAIAFKSKLQTIVATSSTEAEFICAVQAGKTVKYLRTVLHDLGFTPQGPTIIYEDNQAAIAMINSSKPTPRSRHIDTQHYAIQGWKARDILRLEHIPGTLSPADALTKPLARILHHRHSRRMMGHYGPPAYATYAYVPPASAAVADF
jgi:Reverse transcriptase (RNA-dependent DNA polymerase)